MKKRLLSTFLALCIAMTLLPVSALAANSQSNEFASPVVSSTVVPEGYIGIYTVADLINCAWASDGSYILMADLDMGNSTGAWNPVEFRGVLDGNGHIIKNLHISAYGTGEQSSNSYCYGLFSSLYGTVKNLALSDISIEVTGDFSNNVCVGSIAGEARATIENCKVTGQVIVTPNITSDIYSLSVGGLVGTVSGSPSTILSSANYATISVQSTGNPEKVAVGGLMGSQGTWANTMSISKSINSGTITADGSGVIYAGGIAGTIRKISISCCKNTGEISATASSSHIATGGVVGWADGSATSTISQCCNLGNVSGTGRATSGTYGGSGAGGILGGTHYQHVASIEDNYNSGDISLEDTFNGLSGYASKAGGVGGILGQDCKNDTSVKTSYSYGAVTSETVSSNVVISDGGIIGFAVKGNVETCFWRFDITDAIGISRNGSSVSGSGILTTGNAGNQDTYSGFDFNSVWTMGAENYTLPILQWENTASSYSVSYNLNGGNGDIPVVQSYVVGSTVLITSTIPTKEGYIFNGWSDGSSTYRAGETFTMPEKDVSLTAVWAQSSNDGESAYITSLYPANGATEVGYGANSPKKFQITFDREIANDGAIAQVNLSRPGAFSVYRASDDQPVYQSTQYSTHNFLIVYQQENTLSISSTELDPGSEYYITLDAGVVQFKDGTTNPAIAKGEWQFTTEYAPIIDTVDAKTYSGEFSFLSDLAKDAGIGDKKKTLTYTYHYDDNWFFENSSTYQHELVQMSIRVAMAAFDSGIVSDRSKNIKELMHDLDFEYDEKSDNSIHYPSPTNNSIGYAISNKNIKAKNGETCSVIMVAIRGAGYESEWGGNFYIGSDGDHSGFSLAAAQVTDGLKKYIAENQNSLLPTKKIWIVGYSRAAATANLVARYLNDGAIKNINSQNVFAFCFECPQNTNNLYRSTQHSNIVNIINPIDFVPKVAMSSWGYGRYGVTYVLPSKESTKKYKLLKEKMEDVYESIFSYNNAKYPSIASIYTEERSGQASTLDDFMDNLADEFVSPSYYSQNHEVRMMEIATRTLGKEGGILANPGSFLVELVDLGSLVKSHPFNTASTIALFTKGYAGYAHYPELCLSWIDSLQGNYDDTYANYRKVFINCPVDITVHDSTQQIVAKIENNIPQELEEGLVSYIDDDGQKVVILPADEEYTISLKAKSAGTVTYTAIEYNIDSGTTEKVISYYEIDVAENDTLVGLVENLDKVSSAQYPLYLNSADEALSPSVEQSGGAVQKFSVEVSKSGNGTVLGGGSYVSGEFVKVTATANSGETFLGWYIGNALTSSDTEYRFLVKEDVNIVAKFTTNTTQNIPSNPGISSGPSGSGGGSDGGYSISVPSRITGGTVSVRPTSASEGNKVTITTKPNSGYEVGTVTVTDKNGKQITVTDAGDGKYTFIMPNSKVDVNVGFVRIQTPSNTLSFTDVQSGAYYYDAVQWAVEQGITAGTSATTFSPDASCTRAQIVTFLWRAAGSPKASTSNPFTDVPVDSYYYDAVLWAVEQGITSGTSATTFSPDATCTRAQAVTFLYRYEKSPAISGTNNFVDVATGTYYADAVQWAVDKNVTAGTSATTFSPNATCTRGQIVTFLYRDMA